MRIFTQTLELPDERSPAGNAYCIMGFVTEAMEKAFSATEDERFNKEARDKYLKDATSGDYTHLRKVSQDMFNLMNDYDQFFFPKNEDE